MRWWWSRAPVAESHVEEVLRDQVEKVAQEKDQIKDLMAGAQRDQQVAERKLEQAQRVSQETEQVTAAIRREEEKNGLAILFRRGLGGIV